MDPSIPIGFDPATGDEVLLSPDGRKGHMLLVSGTGGGKTTQLYSMCREDAVRPSGFLCIDFTGNLYPELVKLCALLDIPDRVILIDPSDPEYSVGLNYLEPIPGSDPGVLTQMAMTGISRVFKEETTVKPLWELFGPSTIRPLCETGHTLLDIPFFCDPDNGDFRLGILQQTQDVHLLKTWNDLERDYPRPSDRARQVMVVYNRGQKFWQVAAFRRIVGQSKSSIRWRDAMDEGKIVLCNLGSGNHLTDELAQQLAIIIFHQVIQAARTRRGKDPRPFYFYIDEFHLVTSKHFAGYLALLRQYGVPLILSIQNLYQLMLEGHDESLLRSALTNARTKMVGAVSPEDAEILVPHLFLDRLDPERVKYQGERTLLVPHQHAGRLYGGRSGSSRTRPVDYHDSLEGTETLSDDSSWHDALMTEYEERKEPDTPVFYSLPEQAHIFKQQLVRQKPGDWTVKVWEDAAFSMRGHLSPALYPPEEYVARFIERSAEHHNIPRSRDVDRQIDDATRRALGDCYDVIMAELVPASVTCRSLPPALESAASEPSALAGEKRSTHELTRRLKAHGVHPSTARSLVRDHAPAYLEHHIRVHDSSDQPQPRDIRARGKRLAARIRENWDPPAPDSTDAES